MRAGGALLLHIKVKLIAHPHASRRAHCHRVRPRLPRHKITSAAFAHVRLVQSRACDIPRVRRVRPGRVEVLAPFFCAADEHIHVRVRRPRPEAQPVGWWWWNRMDAGQYPPLSRGNRAQGWF